MVRDLIEGKFNLSFLLEYLRSLVHMLFQRQAFKKLDAEIVVAEEVLARAHAGLEVKRKLVLSSLIVPAISQKALC